MPLAVAVFCSHCYRERELLDPGQGVWKILDINTLGSGMGATPLIESASPRTRHCKQCNVHYTITALILPDLCLFSSLRARYYGQLCSPQLILHSPRPLFIFYPPHSMFCCIPDFILHTMLHTPHPICIAFLTFSCPCQYSIILLLCHT